MTIGPLPMIRILWRSVRLGMVTGREPYASRPSRSTKISCVTQRRAHLDTATVGARASRPLLGRVGIPAGGTPALLFSGSYRVVALSRYAPRRLVRIVGLRP